MATYISLFSSAGVGCYGFKMAGFDCIATNEIVQRRLDIQKYNHKCKYNSGYICQDITLEETKNLIRSEIKLWQKKESLKRVDVIIATPPCQGMSVANHKKNDKEKIRNSLVIESIKLICEIKPSIFIFENVSAFMKTICTDTDGIDKPISEAIKRNLGSQYSYMYKIINFKDYGACSSRSRTLVIGVSNELANDISPFELFPNSTPLRTLRETIGHLPSLTQMGQIYEKDIYHAFRPYPEHMRYWIENLKEGECAFDQSDDKRKPHKIENGKIIINVNKNGDKYTRQIWDKVGPCVHTRNDQLASQNTIHPQDDRVFSIRELMLMMTIPPSFKWCEQTNEELNNLTDAEKTYFLKNNAIKIRQSLGEAVPTTIFHSIAQKIISATKSLKLNNINIKSIIRKHNLTNSDNLIKFIEENPDNLSLSSLSRIAEILNTNRTEDAAFYTHKALITEMVKQLPDIEKDTIHILEPSAGVGNFIPMVAKRYEGKNIIFDLYDIDANSIKIAKTLIKKYELPSNCKFNYNQQDFLLHDFNTKYDLIIGNPPFYDMKSNDKLLTVYRKSAINKKTTDLCSFFLDKIVNLGNFIAIVFPKFILNTPEFAITRNYLAQKSISCIIDFGEKGFPGVKIETIALFINNQQKPKETKVISLTYGIELNQIQKYIFDTNLPYWIIYRNKLFDNVCQKLDFDKFKVFRDRQITNSMLASKGSIRVLKSRNISIDGNKIDDIDNYDAFIDQEKAATLSVYKFLDDKNVYLTPNMTYYPRVIKKPSGVLVNGSVAILIPKDSITLTQEQCDYFASQEYREFYKIARNYQTRSLNIDSCSVFFFGILRKNSKTSPQKENITVQPKQLTLF